MELFYSIAPSRPEYSKQAASCKCKNTPSSIYTQSLGSRSTFSNLSSLLPLSASCMYIHLAVNGRLIRILSTLAPGVFRPKLVPLSWTRLNSTYRPLLNCCHSFSLSVKSMSFRFSMRGRYEGRKAVKQSLMKEKISSCSFSSTSKSSKKIPPMPRDSPRWGIWKYLSHHCLKRG